MALDSSKRERKGLTLKAKPFLRIWRIGENGINKVVVNKATLAQMRAFSYAK
jgi:hypothetical protein